MIDVEVYENLKEMNFGIWEGMHSEDVVRDYEDNYQFILEADTSHVEN